MKNKLKSEEFRREGDKKYKNRAYVKAVESYNKSICFAENGSVQLAIAYTNRSAAYLAMNLPTVCLANIELAMGVPTCPDHVKVKLEERIKKCHKKKQQVNEDPGPMMPKLSYPAHPKIPFVANCVELAENAAEGKHLVANRDLKVGDIIAIEKPFCSALHHSFQYVRCDNCTEEHSSNLIPCESCTNVMFCGVECRAEAMRGYHRYECGVIDPMQEQHPENRLLARIMLQALAMFNGNLMEFQLSKRNSNSTVFDNNYTKTLTPIEIFAPVHSLSTYGRFNQKLVDEILAYLSSVFQSKGMTTFSQQRSHLMNIIRKLTQSSRHMLSFRNSKDVEKLTAEYSKPEFSRQENLPAGDLDAVLDDTCMLAFGMYPFTSLAPRSCAPNVKVIPHGNQMIMIVLRPIATGRSISRCDA